MNQGTWLHKKLLMMNQNIVAELPLLDLSSFNWHKMNPYVRHTNAGHNFSLDKIFGQKRLNCRSSYGLEIPVKYRLHGQEKIVQ